MAIDAKMSMLRQVEEKLSDRLTANDMGIAMEIISDVLEGFDLREHPRWGETQDDLLDSFVAALKVSGRSQKTIDRYAYIIQRFMKTINVPTRAVNVYHIRNWLAAEKARGLMDSTLEGIRQVLSSYFGWLHRECLIERDPMANVGPIKVAKRQKGIYSDTDMIRLIKACTNDRDQAIIYFLASTGCRISEMTGLNRDQIDLERMTCIVHGKGNKERPVYFDAVTSVALSKYLASRMDDGEELFRSHLNKRILPGGVRCMLKEVAARAGVDHVHPHKFRRTKATMLARHGMPIQEVARILGHDKLETTMGYVINDDNEIHNNYRRYA